MMFKKKEKKLDGYTFVTQQNPYEWDGKVRYFEYMSPVRYSTYEEAEKALKKIMRLKSKIEKGYIVKVEGIIYRDTSIVSIKF